MGLSSYGADYNGQPGIVETQFFNNNLKWETNYNANFGLDVNVKKIKKVLHLNSTTGLPRTQG
ncbi:MAG: hypothetical protein R2756_05795 [Bacteroidales bacterium]